MTPAEGTVGAILNTVTKEDVIAIFVQERSDELDALKKAGEAELRQLDAAIQAVQAKWPKVTASHKNRVSTALDEKAVKALTGAGHEKLIVEVSDGERDDNKNIFTFRVTLKSSESRSYYGGLTRDETVAYDAKAIEILTETARIRRETSTAQQHMLAIRREIADIPIMERRARAKFAMVSLSRDKDGMALLAEMRKVKELSTSVVG